jgi:hypothetical protein
MRSAWPGTCVVISVAALAACGGAADGADGTDVDDPDDVAAIDAGTPDAPALPDAAPGLACAGGGIADVVVDPGMGADTVTYPHAWWNRGDGGGKSCFAVALVIAIDDPLIFDSGQVPDVVEVWFASEPVLGANEVTVRAQAHALELPGTFVVATFDEATLAGELDAAGIIASVTGDVSGNACAAIFDPCL